MAFEFNLIKYVGVNLGVGEKKMGLKEVSFWQEETCYSTDEFISSPYLYHFIKRTP